ncbi:MAG: S41 family peptidase [Planctomycetota bacterium]
MPNPIQSVQDQPSRAARLAAIAAPLLAAAAIAAGIAASPSPAAAALAQPESPATDASTRAVEQWRQDVWDAASAGRFDDTLQILSNVPDDADPAATADLASAIQRLQANIAKRDTDRTERIEQERDEFAEALDRARTTRDDADVSEALAIALLLETLVEDRDAFLSEPDVVEVIDLADQIASQAETEQDWLATAELYARLNLLTEASQRFKPDLQRQVLRRDQLRLYIPEPYWNMRDARVQELEARAQTRWDERKAELDAEATNESNDESSLENDANIGAEIEADNEDDELGERPEIKGLPDYVQRGDTYQTKLDDISVNLALAAINNAAAKHISASTIRDMAVGGIDLVAMLVDNTDMALEFPGLSRDADLAEFRTFLEEERTKLAAGNAPISIFDLRKTINRLIYVNNDTIALPDQVIVHEFGAGAMNTLDEFTAIIWPHELRQFYKRLGSSFIGVGVQIINDPATGDLKVHTPLSGMPAQRAGVRAGDIITHVNGEPMIGIATDDAVDIITGPEGTNVTLSISRETPEGDTIAKDITITRAKIDIPTITGWNRLRPDDAVDAWDWFIDRNQGIGYVRLEKFADDSTRELDTAIRHMRDQGLRGLILDLRFNSGGQFDRAIEIVNRFVPEGTLVSTVDSRVERPETHRARASQATLTDLPVAILINSNSASASEIVAGSVKAHARRDNADAIVIGERSYGKGTVQNVHGIGGQIAAMKVTTQYYQLPDGKVIHRQKGSSQWGVTPNLEVPLLPEQISESLLIRSRADTIQIDEFGQEIAIEDEDDINRRRDPAELITEGIDLQLETALVLLKARVPTDTSSTAMRDDG